MIARVLDRTKDLGSLCSFLADDALIALRLLRLRGSRQNRSLERSRLVDIKVVDLLLLELHWLLQGTCLYHERLSLCIYDALVKSLDHII